LLKILGNAIYNLYFHPLARVPGSLFARISGIPAWYHALLGDRHIWLWQQFQIYGDVVRTAPNTVMFCSSQAVTDIYGTKGNVRRSDFYAVWERHKEDKSAFTSIDRAEHARRRKILNLAFTEKSTRAASTFIIRHVDRWCELVAGDCHGNDWSAPVDFSEKVDGLIFDIMGDLSFGASFDIKEPGENPLKVIPHNVARYIQYMNPVSPMMPVP